MSAALLREAAAKMLEQAEAATPGPWIVSDCEGELQVWPESLCEVAEDRQGDRYVSRTPRSWPTEALIVEHDLETWDEGEDSQEDTIRATARHIAAWHPQVAITMATWLTALAEEWDRWTDIGLSDDEVVGQDLSSEHALLIARTYLGRAG